MPLSFRPNATVWIWLDSDKDIELAKRPRFKCRVMTCEQVDGWCESYEKLVNDSAGYDKAIQLLLTHIVDWENFPEPLSAEAIKRTLTMREVWTLARSLPSRIGLQEDDLGKSDSPLLTAGVASVDPAPAEDATTSPVNANPS